MGVRKDGSFPLYTAIDLDPSSPPEKYWEGNSKRCIECQKRWPHDPHFVVSPCCSAQMMKAPESPSIPWDQAVRALLAWKFNQLYDKYNAGTNEEQQIWMSDPLPIEEEEVDEGVKEIFQQIDDLTKE